jgi:hypothetical protein
MSDSPIVGAVLALQVRLAQRQARAAEAEGRRSAAEAAALEAAEVEAAVRVGPAWRPGVAANPTSVGPHRRGARGQFGQAPWWGPRDLGVEGWLVGPRMMQILQQ